MFVECVVVDVVDVLVGFDFQCYEVVVGVGDDDFCGLNFYNCNFFVVCVIDWFVLVLIVLVEIVKNW